MYQKNYDEVRNMLTADEINSWDADADELRNLIFSKYGEYLKDLTWENSTLREWLNKEFYETSFDKNVGVRPTIYIDLSDDSVIERYNNLEDKPENIIHFDERMFKNEKTDKIAETTIAEEDIEYYYSGGKWD